MIGRKVELAKRALQADEAIALIDPSRAESITRAKEAVDALKDQDPTLHAITDARLTERRDLLNDATLRLGNAALALAPPATSATGNNAETMSPDEIERAWCLKHALERLLEQDRRLHTPAVSTALVALGRVPPPTRRPDPREGPVAAHEQAISNLKQVFDIVNKSLDAADGDASTFNIAKYDPIAASLDTAAERAKKMKFDSEFQASAAFGRLAGIIRHLKGRVIQNMPISVPAGAPLGETVDRAISTLQALQKQLARESGANNEAKILVQSTLEALTKMRNEMDRKH